MDQQMDLNDSKGIAAQIDAEICALPLRNTPSVRAVRCKHSRKLKQASPKFILDLARELFENFGYRQLNALFRLLGLLRWMFRRKARWGEMQRTARWSAPAPKKSGSEPTPPWPQP